MVIIIALLFVAAVLFSVIYSLIKASGESDEIEEQMRKYEETEKDSEKEAMKRKGHEEFELIRRYIELLQSYKNQKIISCVDYEVEKKEALEKANDILYRYGLCETEEERR